MRVGLVPRVLACLRLRSLPLVHSLARLHACAGACVDACAGVRVCVCAVVLQRWPSVMRAYVGVRVFCLPMPSVPAFGRHVCEYARVCVCVCVCLSCYLLFCSVLMSCARCATASLVSGVCLFLLHIQMRMCRPPVLLQSGRSLQCSRRVLVVLLYVPVV